MQLLTSTDRYLARLIAVPLIATLVLSAMLLLLDKMLRLFDFVVQQGGPVGVVWRMLANTIPEYMSLGIPIGLMLGVLLAFRRLAMSSELDVFRALGISYGRLLRVPYLYAIGLAAVNLAIVGFVQPYSHYAYEGLRYELRSGALGASIKVGEFTKLGKKETVRIERSRDGGRELSGIFVHAANDQGRTIAVSAASGAFFATDDPDTIIFRLHDGTLVQNQPRLQDAARALLHQPRSADRAAQGGQLPHPRHHREGRAHRPRAVPHGCHHPLAAAACAEPGGVPFSYGRGRDHVPAAAARRRAGGAAPSALPPRSASSFRS